MFNVVIRAYFLMKRISSQHYEDLQRQFHYLYRNLPVAASVVNLSTASQIKATLKKNKIDTDKYEDRVYASCLKASVVYAQKAIEVQHPVVMINVMEHGAKEDLVKNVINDFSLKMKQFFAFFSNRFKNNHFDNDYYSKNLMVAPSVTRQLQVSCYQEFLPAPSIAKKDLLVINAMNDETRKAEDLQIMMVKIDSSDAKLLNIPDVSTVTNKDTRTDINNLCKDMLDKLLVDHIHPTESSTVETTQEDNDAYFLSLFNTNVESSAVKPVAVDSTTTKMESNHSQKKIPRRSSSRYDLERIFFYKFISFALGLPALRHTKKMLRLRMIWK